LFEQAGPFELAVVVLEAIRGVFLAAMFGDDQRANAEQPGSGAAEQAQRGCVLRGRVVRRIEKEYIVPFSKYFVAFWLWSFGGAA
jgi:hypothetical protein